MKTSTQVKARELDRNPDLVDVVSAARDAGHEVMLIERPMPDAVSIAALGRVFDIVSDPGGVALENAEGERLDFEPSTDGNRIRAASRLWRRMGLSTEAIAVGGFAYRTDREPAGVWSGFPALLFRVPALAVVRKRGRTFVVAAEAGAEDLLELTSPAVRAPSARQLQVTPVRNPVAWTAAVDTASARLRAGEAEKVVLAREVLARGGRCHLGRRRGPWPSRRLSVVFHLLGRRRRRHRVRRSIAGASRPPHGRPRAGSADGRLRGARFDRRR